MALSPVLLLLAAATPAAQPASTDPLDQVVCHREEVTGSLVTTRKVCHTRREWRRISDDAQSESRRITNPGTLNDLNG